MRRRAREPRTAELRGSLGASPEPAPRTIVPTPRSRRLLALVAPLLLFLVSGATALVGQLCFSRYLAYVVGATAYAVSTVLAAFMAGLALGAHLAGRYAWKLQRPLLAYGCLELVVAVSLAAAPYAFEAITPLYVRLVRAHPDSLVLVTAVRWALAVSVVLVPTTAMGATLPLLSRVLGAHTALEESERRRRERWLGALYATNTFGGALGALGAAYLALPEIGLRSTLGLAAAGGASVGLLALAVGSLVDKSEVTPPEELGEAPRATSLALLSLFSGAVVLGAEVVFTHLLALIIGNSAYAFGLILATFLACLGFGASLAPLVHRRFAELAPALTLACAGLALAGTLPFWDDLPLYFSERALDYKSFEAREVVRGVVAFAILVVPTTAMGLTFPLVLQRIAGLGTLSRLAGRMTAVNTIGAVAGSLLFGFLVLPKQGSERSVVTLAVLLAGAGAVAALVEKAATKPRARLAALVVAASTLPVVALAPRWNLTNLTAGTNVYFSGIRPVEEVVMLTEDVHGGVTTVTKTGPVYTLNTNGKFQGNNSFEMAAQRYFTLYPVMFAPRFDHAMIIGMGTATSLGTLAGFPFQRLTAVEISPAIVVAAKRYFTEVNFGVLDDPRLRVVLDDGRHHLLVTTERYDLIGMELSSIWFAGASALYSREFYRLVREHLTPGGVYQQWIQLHHMSRADAATILATLKSEFPHVALFYGGGQGVLVASLEPLRASAGRYAELSRSPAAVRVLPPGRSPREILDDCLVVGAGVDTFIDEMLEISKRPRSRLVSTDDNVLLEFSTPRSNVLPWNSKDTLLADLRRHRRPAEVEALLVP